MLQGLLGFLKMQSLLFYWRLHAIKTWYYSLKKKKKPKKQSEVAQSCPTLSDPVDCSLLGSSVHGIFQARVLEWAAIAFSLTHLYFPVEVQVWPLWTLPSAPPSKLHSRGREHLFALFHCFTQSNNEEAKMTIITIFLSLFSEQLGQQRMTSFWWHHRFNGHEFEQTPGDGEQQNSILQSMGLQRVGHSWETE